MLPSEGPHLRWPTGGAVARRMTLGVVLGLLLLAAVAAAFTLVDRSRRRTAGPITDTSLTPRRDPPAR